MGPDGLLYWARESEKRAEALQELRDDEEALRKYLVVNEPQQKFLELWRMSQIQVLRSIKEHPDDMFQSVSCRGFRPRAKTLKPRCRLETIQQRHESHANIAETVETLMAPVDLCDVSQRSSIPVNSIHKWSRGASFARSRGGSVHARTRSRAGSVRTRSRNGSANTRSRNGSVNMRSVTCTLPVTPNNGKNSISTPFSRSRGGSANSPSHSGGPRSPLFSLSRKNSYRDYVSGVYSKNDSLYESGASGRSTPSELP